MEEKDEIKGHMVSYSEKFKQNKKKGCLYLWLFAHPSLSEQMPGIIPTPDQP